MSDIRLDKYLWAVRIFKTRSDAADAIRQNRVLVNDAYAKPSREVKVGDRISVRETTAFKWVDRKGFLEYVDSDKAIAVNKFEDFIKNETLSVNIEVKFNLVEEVDLNGHSTQIDVEKN